MTDFNMKNLANLKQVRKEAEKLVANIGNIKIDPNLQESEKLRTIQSQLADSLIMLKNELNGNSSTK